MTATVAENVPAVPCPACVCTLGGEQSPAPSRENTESHDGAVVSSAMQHGNGTATATATTTNYILLLFYSSSTAESKAKVRLVWGGRDA